MSNVILRLMKNKLCNNEVTLREIMEFLEHATVLKDVTEKAIGRPYPFGSAMYNSLQCAHSLDEDEYIDWYMKRFTELVN